MFCPKFLKKTLEGQGKFLKTSPPQTKIHFAPLEYRYISRLILKDMGIQSRNPGTGSRL